jgi:Fe-S-cluster-containing dehydrogenase component
MKEVNQMSKSKKGLLVDYNYCTGCHACEVACKNHLELPVGKWGIKLVEVGPFEIEKGTPSKFEWINMPIPTELCDMCEDEVAKGYKPMCVHHCMAACLEYGTLDELTKTMATRPGKQNLYMPV